MPHRFVREFGRSGVAASVVVLIAASAFGQTPPNPQRIRVMSIDGGEPRPATLAADFAEGGRYTAQGAPEFSPDGRTVVFDGWKASEGETNVAAHVFVVPADGSGDPVDLGDGCLPSFSRDGKTIAFSRYGGLGAWLMDADGRNRRPIAPGGWSVQWSPAADEVAYTSGRDFVIRDMTTGAERRVPASDTGRPYWNFDWSPDGKSIAYVRDAAERYRELCVVSVEGNGGPPRVLHRAHPNNTAEFHADGATVFFSQPHPDYRRLQIYTISAAGGPPKLWDHQDPRFENHSLAVSNDGTKIVFSRQGLPVFEPNGLPPTYP